MDAHTVSWKAIPHITHGCEFPLFINFDFYIPDAVEINIFPAALFIFYFIKNSIRIALESSSVLLYFFIYYFISLYIFIIKKDIPNINILIDIERSQV